MKLTKLALPVAVAALALGAGACGDSDDDSSGGDDADKVRIGLEAPLSGDLQTLGEGMLNGAELAADKLNDGGGIGGRDVEIVPIDDGGDAAVGVPAAQEAIDSGLDGVVGPYNSGVGVETLPVSDYEDEFGEEPGTWSPYTYDSVNVLAEAVEKAGGFEAEGLEKALGEVKGFEGWTGSTTLVPCSGNREPATVTVDRVDEAGAFTVDPAWAKAVGAPY